MYAESSIKHGVYCTCTQMSPDVLFITKARSLAASLKKRKKKKIMQPVLSCLFFRHTQENQGNRWIAVVVASDSQIQVSWGVEEDFAVYVCCNAWSVSPVWQEMSWNDPGVSNDQKQFTYSSFVLNPFRIFGGKESSGRKTQLDKLHLQAADHPGWQVKNPLIPSRH